MFDISESCACVVDFSPLADAFPPDEFRIYCIAALLDDGSSPKAISIWPPALFTSVPVREAMAWLRVGNIDGTEPETSPRGCAIALLQDLTWNPWLDSRWTKVFLRDPKTDQPTPPVYQSIANTLSALCYLLAQKRGMEHGDYSAEWDAIFPLITTATLA